MTSPTTAIHQQCDACARDLTDLTRAVVYLTLPLADGLHILCSICGTDTKLVDRMIKAATRKRTTHDHP